MVKCLVADTTITKVVQETETVKGTKIASDLNMTDTEMNISTVENMRGKENAAVTEFPETDTITAKKAAPEEKNANADLGHEVQAMKGVSVDMKGQGVHLARNIEVVDNNLLVELIETETGKQRTIGHSDLIHHQKRMKFPRSTSTRIRWRRLESVEPSLANRTFCRASRPCQWLKQRRLTGSCMLGICHLASRSSFL